MKNRQKGFVIPLLLTIVVLSGILGGYYVYNQKNTLKNSSEKNAVLDDNKISESTSGVSSNTQDLTNNTSQENNKTDDTADSYFTYVNTAGNYSLLLPKGWGVADTDSSGKTSSSFQAMRSLNKKISIDDISKVDVSKTEIISLSVATPKDEQAMEKFYSTMFKSLKIIDNLNSVPSFIKEVRKGIMQEDCKGIEYVLKTTKKVYMVQICYPDESKAIEAEGYLKNIVSSLKEL